MIFFRLGRFLVVCVAGAFARRRLSAVRFIVFFHSTYRRTYRVCVCRLYCVDWSGATCEIRIPKKNFAGRFNKFVIR